MKASHRELEQILLVTSIGQGQKFNLQMCLLFSIKLIPRRILYSNSSVT